jgi:hypothetical protein
MTNKSLLLGLFVFAIGACGGSAGPTVPGKVGAPTAGSAAANPGSGAAPTGATNGNGITPPTQVGVGHSGAAGSSSPFSSGNGDNSFSSGIAGSSSSDISSGIAGSSSGLPSTPGLPGAP